MNDTRAYTHEELAGFAVDAMRSYVTRALTTAERIAQAAQRGQKLVVDQELKMLASLRAEAERYDWLCPERTHDEGGKA